MEYVKVVQHYDFDYATVKKMVSNCIGNSFLEGTLKRSEQAALEQAFDEFEENLANGFREPVAPYRRTKAR